MLSYLTYAHSCKTVGKFAENVDFAAGKCEIRSHHICTTQQRSHFSNGALTALVVDTIAGVCRINGHVADLQCCIYDPEGHSVHSELLFSFFFFISDNVG